MQQMLTHPLQSRPAQSPKLTLSPNHSILLSLRFSFFLREEDSHSSDSQIWIFSQSILSCFLSPIFSSYCMPPVLQNRNCEFRRWFCQEKMLTLYLQMHFHTFLSDIEPGLFCEGPLCSVCWWLLLHWRIYLLSSNLIH